MTHNSDDIDNHNITFTKGISLKIIPSGQIRSLPREISGEDQVEIGWSDSRERTRLACWFRRLAETNFVECRSTVFDFCRIVRCFRRMKFWSLLVKAQCLPWAGAGCAPRRRDRSDYTRKE